MITIDYVLSCNPPVEDLLAVDQTTLRYHALPGDIILNADGRDFSARWGWVPILDFDLCLQKINIELQSAEDAVSSFEFTESEATLSFARDGDYLVIAASYAPGMARVELSEFAAAVQTFHSKLQEDVRTNFSLLLGRKDLLEMLRIVKGL